MSPRRPAEGGTSKIADIDGHLVWIRAKVASILCIWDRRSMVTRDDWEVADIIVKNSCAVRDAAVDISDEVEDSLEEERIAKNVARSAAVKVGMERIAQIAHQLSEKVKTAGRMSHNDLRKTLRSTLRSLYPMAIEYAELHGLVVRDGQTGWTTP